jgi:hypothetical protein
LQAGDDQLATGISFRDHDLADVVPLEEQRGNRSLADRTSHVVSMEKPRAARLGAGHPFIFEERTRHTSNKSGRNGDVVAGARKGSMFLLIYPKRTRSPGNWRLPIRLHNRL